MSNRGKEYVSVGPPVNVYAPPTLTPQNVVKISTTLPRVRKRIASSPIPIVGTERMKQSQVLETSDCDDSMSDQIGFKRIISKGKVGVKPNENEKLQSIDHEKIGLYEKFLSDTFRRKFRIWKKQVKLKDEQFIGLLKREESRVNRLRKTIASWRLVDEKKRQTMETVFMLSIAENLAPVEIMKLWNFVNIAYEYLPLDYLDVWNNKSEILKFMETHGLITKVVKDVKQVKEEMNRTLNEEPDYSLDDVMSTLQNQNERIYHTIENYDASTVSTQTSPEVFYFLRNEPLEDHYINELIMTIKPSKRNNRLEERSEHILTKEKRINQKLQEKEEKYLAERKLFKMKESQNNLLLESLEHQMMHCPSKKKRSLIKNQIDLLKPSMAKLKREHQERISVLIHEIREDKEEKKKLEKEIEAMKKRIEFYHQEQDKLQKTHDIGPEGFVTLMFTDVQGSTGLWQANPEAMQQALMIHNSCIRQIIQETNGYEVKTEGDAFMIAHQYPLDAIECAMLIQTRLLDINWANEILELPETKTVSSPDGKKLFHGLRVRAGIHAGHCEMILDPVTKRSDYFGNEINRAARIEGQATYGGQVMISEVIWDALKGVPDLSLPKVGKLSVQYVGSVSLKGLSTPETIRMILPENLSAREFPKTNLAVKKRASVLEEKISRYQLQLEIVKSVLKRTESKMKTESLIKQEKSEEINRIQDEIEIQKKAMEKALEEEKEKVAKDLEAQLDALNQQKKSALKKAEKLEQLMNKEIEASYLEKELLEKEKTKKEKKIERLLSLHRKMAKDMENLFSEKKTLEIRNLENLGRLERMNQEIIQYRSVLEEQSQALSMEKEIVNIHESNKIKLTAKLQELEVSLIKEENLRKIAESQAESLNFQLERNDNLVKQFHEKYASMKDRYRKYRKIVKSKLTTFLAQINGKQETILNLEDLVSSTESVHREALNNLQSTDEMLLNDVQTVIHYNNLYDLLRLTDGKPGLPVQKQWTSLKQKLRKRERPTFDSFTEFMAHVIKVLQACQDHIYSQSHILKKINLERDLYFKKHSDLLKKYEHMCSNSLMEVRDEVLPEDEFSSDDEDGDEVYPLRKEGKNPSLSVQNLQFKKEKNSLLKKIFTKKSLQKQSSSTSLKSRKRMKRWNSDQTIETSTKEMNSKLSKSWQAPLPRILERSESFGNRAKLRPLYHRSSSTDSVGFQKVETLSLSRISSADSLGSLDLKDFSNEELRAMSRSSQRSIPSSQTDRSKQPMELKTTGLVQYQIKNRKFHSFTPKSPPSVDFEQFVEEELNRVETED